MSHSNRLLSECRFQLSRLAVRVVLLLAISLSASAVILGYSEVSAQRATIERLSALDAEERAGAWEGRDDWGDIAYNGFHYTFDRPSSLAFAALGQRDILPWQHRLRMLALEGQIHERDPANPDLAQLGQFDFALVVCLLLPLLVIVLVSDVKAAERSAGRDALLIATAGDSHLWRDRALVLALLLGLSLLTPFWIGGALSGTPFTLTVLTTLLVVIYLAFWTWLVLRFALSGATAQVTALRLVGLWFIFAIAVPLLGRVVILGSVPLPEPGEILMLQREEVNAAWDKPKPVTMNAFVEAHPQWREQSEVTRPFEWKWYYAFQQVGDQQAAPLAGEYREGIVARERMAWWLGLLSPPLLLHKALTCLARTDLSAALSYEDAIRDFHQDMRHFYYPLLFNNPAFDPERLQRHPTFEEARSSCVI